MAPIEQRMRELARTVPPADVQLYYQTLLIGRKELPFAPDRRMGVEMTLLRALAFHPRAPLPEPEVPRQSFAPVAPTAVMSPQQVPPAPQPQPSPAPGRTTYRCRMPPVRCLPRAASCSVRREQPNQKRVNRQRQQERGR